MNCACRDTDVLAGVRRKSAIIALLAMLPAAGRALACDLSVAPLPDATDMGPRHHPIGRPLPDSPTYNAPNACQEGVWFYDLNGNGLADGDEPRLFGASRYVACPSCHGGAVSAGSGVTASLGLRRDAAKLCLVCHRM